jgi:hypothetical protein
MSSANAIEMFEAASQSPVPRPFGLVAERPIVVRCIAPTVPTRFSPPQLVMNSTEEWARVFERQAISGSCVCFRAANLAELTS